MRAGAFNRRLAIQRRSSTVDAIGGQSTTWTTIATVWAAIEGLSGRELLAAQATNAAVTHQIMIRYQPLFADPKAVAAMRAVLVKDGITRIFNIHGAVDDKERRQTIMIWAEEGLTNG